MCGALLWRVHLLFWPFYFVFLAYMAVRAARRENQVGAVRLGAVISLLGIVLAPVFLDAMSLYRQAGQHVVMALPSVRDLVASLKFGLVLVCGGGAYLAMRLRRRRGDFPVAGKASVVLVLSWWLCQPLCLFAASWLTGRSVFVPRYLWLALPGAALAATLAASRFIPAKLWKPAAAALGLGALLLNGQWSRPWPLHHNSDWRRAADAIEGSVKGPDVPVICPSPFIEAKTPVWSPEYRLPGFLYAQLYVYPIPGRIYPFPFESSPEAEAFAARLSKDVFPGADRFLIYGGAGHVAFWSEWFERRPELARWRNTPLGPFADVEVVLFERP